MRATALKEHPRSWWASGVAPPGLEPPWDPFPTPSPARGSWTSGAEWVRGTDNAQLVCVEASLVPGSGFRRHPSVPRKSPMRGGGHPPHRGSKHAHSEQSRSFQGNCRVAPLSSSGWAALPDGTRVRQARRLLSPCVGQEGSSEGLQYNQPLCSRGNGALQIDGKGWGWDLN